MSRMLGNHQGPHVGGEAVEEAMIRIEVERIVNLVAGFGFKKVEEKISEGKITLTLEKEIPVTEEEAG